MYLSKLEVSLGKMFYGHLTHTKIVGVEYLLDLFGMSTIH